MRLSDIQRIVVEMQKSGMNRLQIITELNARGFKTPMGKSIDVGAYQRIVNGIKVKRIAVRNKYDETSIRARSDVIEEVRNSKLSSRAKDIILRTLMKQE